MNLSDIILQQVKKNVAGNNVQIPANVQNTVINGLSESILGSLAQTATKAGGLDLIKNVLTGKDAAESSPVTKLATDIFSKNILSKLSLGSLASVLTGLIPKIFGGLKGIIKDQDGDGDVDLNDVLLTLKGSSGSILGSVLGGALAGGGSKSSGGGLLGGLAGSVLGSIFGKKK